MSCSLGCGIAAQQAGRCHDEPRRAIAALGAKLLVEAALHRRKAPILSERFHRVDALTIHAGRKRETRQTRLIIDQHGAGTALAAVAAGFCSSEADNFPQIIQQQQIVRHRIDAATAIQNKLENAGHACRSNINIRHDHQIGCRACARKRRRVAGVGSVERSEANAADTMVKVCASRRPLASTSSRFREGCSGCAAGDELYGGCG